ncbi:hypothetical protein HDV02_004729 [Globomyces sp. JEL0801]|nr:hypothetical protein HDV02_004729 [Globomyces sp. JEL0801]
MSSFTSALIIAGCVVHSLLCLLLPGEAPTTISGIFRDIQGILEFEVYLKLNALISIFVRSQTILAATAGSIFSIALAWALLRTGSTNIGVLDVDHQKLGNLFDLFRTTKQSHVRLLCFVGLLIAVTIGLEGIVLQQMLRDGPATTYPFTSKIFIPEIKLPADRFTGVGSGIALKTLVECSSETTESDKIDSRATFVESISTSYPPTTKWIIRKWNKSVNVTHTCDITAGKSNWKENLQGGSRSDFKKYAFSPSDRAVGPVFIASGMAGSLGRLLNGECWGYVNSTAAPLVCSSVMSAMTNTIDRNVAPGVGTEAEMKYVIDRLARRLAAELMTSKEIECQNCEDRLRRYVLPTFKIITILINLIIIILATASIFIIRNVGPVSNDIVTILKLAR